MIFGLELRCRIPQQRLRSRRPASVARVFRSRTPVYSRTWNIPEEPYANKNLKKRNYIKINVIITIN